MNGFIVYSKRLFSDWRTILAAFLLSAVFLGQPVLAQQIYSSSNSYASYAIDVSGNLYIWGEDEYLHQVVTTMTAQDLTPVKVAFPSGATSWVGVAAGHFFSLAIGNDGNVYAWGSNSNGQLGNGTTTDSNTPVKVNLPSGVTATAVACGHYHSLAIGSDGNVYAWGMNNNGQLGNGTTTDSNTPIKVNLPSGFAPAEVCAGWYYSFALGTDGSLYAWGGNDHGQFGNGNTTNQPNPILVPPPTGVTKWTAAYAGIYFVVAKGSDGNLYASGYNTYGQLGDGTTNNSTAFIKANMPSGVTSWKGVACTGSSVLAIANNDTLYGWGYGGSGEMGNGTGGSGATIYTVPTKVSMPTGVTAKIVSAGRNHGLALGSDNYFYTWGQGTQGQLGNNNNVASYVPVKVYGVVPIAPEVPALRSPANKATGQSTSLTLKWSKAPDAAGYQCQVSTDPMFVTELVVNDSTLTDTTKNLVGLGSSTTYYWRVRSYNDGMYSAFSLSDTFTTLVQAPVVPTLILPANNATNQPAIDTLKCSKAAGASKYHWQVRTDLQFSATTGFVVNDSTTDTTRAITLISGTKYYWQVQAVNPGSVSAYAGPDSFTVMAAPAVAPVLLTPANNATNQRPDTLVLKWNHVPAVSGYECQLSTNPSFSLLVVTKDSTSDTAFTVTSLQNLQKYYWRVRAYNAGGITGFSTTDSFTTIIAVPSRPHIISPFAATDISRRGPFVWNSSASATSYRLQISTDNTFSFVTVDTTVADTAVGLSAILDASTQYYWRVSASDPGGVSGYSVVANFTTGTSTDAVNESGGNPKEFSLLQNYPNPFNPSTVIKYNLPKAQTVTLKVYNILGQEIATLVSARQNAGYYEVAFNGNRVASGVYFYVLKTENFSSIHKMLLMK